MAFSVRDRRLIPGVCIRLGVSLHQSNRVDLPIGEVRVVVIRSLFGNGLRVDLQVTAWIVVSVWSVLPARGWSLEK